MKLAKYLKLHGLTQAQFAAKLQVTQTAVSHWVVGRNKIDAELVLPIEAVTNGEVSRHELRPDLYPRDNAA